MDFTRPMSRLDLWEKPSSCGTGLSVSPSEVSERETAADCKAKRTVGDETVALNTSIRTVT